MTPRKHYSELDGIRGLAILLVLICHFGYFAPHSAAQSLLHEILQFGWIGVDLFFVLSGFLITGILLDSTNAAGYFRNFYRRRALRILPLCYGFILFFFHLAIPLAHRLHLWPDVIPRGELWYWLFGANFLNAFDRYTELLGVMWSLSVEEQFYLLWPFLIRFARRPILPRIFASLIVASATLRILAILGWHAGGNMIYTLTPFRLDPLIWGAIAALAIRESGLAERLRRWRTPLLAISFAGLAAAISRGGTLQDAAPMQLIGFSCLAPAFMYLVFTGVTVPAAPLCRILRWSFLRSCGRYSYAMYIFHTLIDRVFRDAFFSLHTRGAIGGGALPFALRILISFAFTYLAAVASWNVLEKRCLAWRAAPLTAPLPNP